ncbi:uncharacterized protein ACMZJ9_014322 [Mantella aurantiaca]
MSSACPLLLLMICGCWALPLPSAMTVIWSVLDNGQNQANLLCLVNSRPDAIITMWISNTNETSEKTSVGTETNIMPASSTQQYYFASRSDQSPIFVVPSHESLSSLSYTGDVGFQLSISLSVKRLPIIAPFTSLNMPFHSVAISLTSTKEDSNFSPSPFQQDLRIHVGQPVLTGNLHNFAHLSLPIDSLRLWDSAASCFLAEAENVDINDITLSGEHSLCYDEEFSMALAFHMKQDFLLVLAIRIIVFKLFIFDLLLTWIALLQTCRLTNTATNFPALEANEPEDEEEGEEM